MAVVKKNRTREFDDEFARQTGDSTLSDVESVISIGGEFAFAGAIDRSSNANEGLLEASLKETAKRDLNGRTNMKVLTVKRTPNYTLPNTVFVLAGSLNGYIAISLFIIKNKSDELTGNMILDRSEAGQNTQLVSDMVNENLKDLITDALQSVYNNVGDIIMASAKVVEDEVLTDPSGLQDMSEEAFNIVLFNLKLINGEIRETNIQTDIIPKISFAQYALRNAQNNPMINETNRITWEASLEFTSIDTFNQNQRLPQKYKSTRGYIDTVFSTKEIYDRSNQYVGEERVLHPMVVLTDTDPVMADTIAYAGINILISSIVANESNALIPIWQNLDKNNVEYLNLLVDVNKEGLDNNVIEPLNIRSFGSKDEQLIALKSIYQGRALYAIDIDNFGDTDMGFNPFLQLAKGNKEAGDRIIQSLVQLCNGHFDPNYPVDRIVSNVISLPKGTMTANTGETISLDNVDVPFLLSTNSSDAIEWANWYNSIMFSANEDSYSEMLRLYKVLGFQSNITGYKGRVLVVSEFLDELERAVKACGLDPVYESLIIGRDNRNYQYRQGSFDRFMASGKQRYASPSSGRRGYGNYNPSRAEW